MSVADKRVELPRMTALGHKQPLRAIVVQCPLSGAKRSFNLGFGGQSDRQLSATSEHCMGFSTQHYLARRTRPAFKTATEKVNE